MKPINAKQPKYKKEIRQEIIENIGRIKNVHVLRNILEISDILARYCDEEQYKTLSEREWSIKSIITDMLMCDEKSVSKLQIFSSIYVSKTSVKNKKRGRENEAN